MKHQYSKKVRLLAVFGLCLNFSVVTLAQESKDMRGLYIQAEIALKNKQFKQANTLFKQLLNNSNNKSQALLGLAKVALNTDELDDGEDLIEQLLEDTPNNPEYLYIAGRIAGKQAQSASIFSKLGYASDAKKYFTKALKIEPQHKPSIIALIRFHQQAPTMAGGDKESIPELLAKLREVDKREAFSIELPQLLEKQEFAIAESYYLEALKSTSEVNTEQFKYDYAMWLSSYGYYRRALEVLLTVDMSDKEATKSFATMRLYQLAKLTAESKTQFELGIKSIKQYAALVDENKGENKETKTNNAIPADWVKFRQAQLDVLANDKSTSQEILLKLKDKTDDSALKTKITSFLEQVAR